jgi:hypothetical protein
VEIEARGVLESGGKPGVRILDVGCGMNAFPRCYVVRGKVMEFEFEELK